MISKKTKRTLLFALVFAVAMLPVYVMGLSDRAGLLIVNVVVAFVMSYWVAIRFIKID
ncbi:hypothetical protein [Pantoea agglomerans]|uniref:hypothetical protein n=1 Tax=Enterobacter agglomerans TaxID=549 RepID=UPI00301778BC